jgi:DNA-binding transcriptional LysR family regulator
MLDVNRLRVLREVGRHHSFSAAAGALSYTPSAISQQIRTLEREVGVGLVERSARGATLTDAGRLLARHADEILGRLAAAEEELQAMLGLGTGRLRLGAFATAGAALVPRAISRYRREHPGVDVSLIEFDPDEATGQLRAYELDLALIYRFPLEPAADLTGLDYIALFNDRLNVALPSEHRLARRKRIRLGELAGDPWIQGVYRGATAGVLPAACRAAGFEPRIVFRSDDHMAVQGSVAAGLGVAVVPELTLTTSRRDIVICPLEVEGDLLTREVGLALRGHSLRPPAVAAMVSVLTSVSRDFGASERRRSRPTGSV